jgi:hypothetical protein
MSLLLLKLFLELILLLFQLLISLLEFILFLPCFLNAFEKFLNTLLFDSQGVLHLQQGSIVLPESFVHGHSNL